MTLASHDFTIVHRPGKQNPADAPSRHPDYAASAAAAVDHLPALQKKLALLSREDAERALQAWDRRNGSHLAVAQEKEEDGCRDAGTCP